MSEATTPPTALNYATPNALEVVDPMRAGPFLVVGRTPRLPDICICCAAVAVSQRIPVQLSMEVSSRINGHLISLRLLNIPAVRLAMPLCAVHFRRRRIGLAVAVSLTLMVIVSAVVTVACKEGPEYVSFSAMGFGLVALLSAVVFAILADYSPRLYNFDGGYYYLKGCGRAFLDRIPSVPGESHF
jgi:hypothetical protein